MVMQDAIVITLDKYGENGCVSLVYPPLSTLKRIEAEVSMRMVRFKKNGEPEVNVDQALESDFALNIFPYIEDAPFEKNLDAFFRFTDALDAKCRGMGETFYNDLVQGIQRVKEGETSPSASSQAAETVSSA